MIINGKTRTIGLIGNPVEHTLSPFIHNLLSDTMKMNSTYLPFKVENHGLETAILGAYELNILGLNVTVPYKEKVMDALVEIDEAAEKIGAVNTLVRCDNLHGFKGYNTDMLGLQRQIYDEKISLNDKTVVILGAGGAAKAVTYMSFLEGAKKIYILNRTLEKAVSIAHDINKIKKMDNLVIPLLLTDYNLIKEEELIVFQATSIGLFPNVNQVVLDDITFYKKVKVGIDLIYNPATTKFMNLVKENGGKAYNALKMLLYQGVIAYELWHKIKVPQSVVNDIYMKLKQKVYNKNNIVLIGFMGSGKSAVGMELAKKRKMDYIDTDAYIEKKEGMSISEIFLKKGEDYFRNLETKILKELRDSISNTVFSTGGGMPLRMENARILKQIGDVFYLSASPKVIYERVKYCKNRPLLQCHNPYDRICSLMKERKNLYENAADFIIDTNSNSIAHTIFNIEHYI